MLSLYQLAREFEKIEFGESHTDIENINNDCYYCNKKLEFSSAYSIFDIDDKIINIDSMFCVRGSIDNIFAYAYEFEDEEEKIFLVRIS